MKPKIIAVDFDGTLCKNVWPEIGEPYNDVIELMKRVRKDGHKVILWTCRNGMPLVNAIVWCAERGLFFDAVNDNLEELKQRFGRDSRKITADYYIDDEAVHPLMCYLYFEKEKANVQ